jgi:hypothetical protein
MTRIFKMETGKPDLRDEMISMAIDEAGNGQIFERVEFHDHISYSSPIKAIASGWTLLGPPTKHFNGYYYEWWFSKDDKASDEIIAELYKCRAERLTLSSKLEQAMSILGNAFKP